LLSYIACIIATESVLINTDDKVVYVESNTVYQFTKESNPSTGCSWVIKNQDEIDSSDLVEYIGSTYESDCESKDIDGCGGEETFSFRIGEIKESDELPEIHMVYGHNWAIETEFYDTVDLVLKVKKSENENGDEEDISDLPVVVYDKNTSDGNVMYVESNTIVQFTQGSNPSTGCSWVIKNQDEIDSSNLVKYIGSTYKSNCQDKRVGCGGEETFRFRIGDIQEGDELPEIHMVYGHSWAIETEFYEMFDLVLKVKKSEKEESCTFKGYPCCTEANPKVRYQDKDGDWGKENGKWCYINQEKQKENDEPKLIRTCTGENLGYPCCEKEHKNIYTDSDGKWAVENGQWCGLPTCTYTGDYPVCKTTTKVVYTDSQKWGVENQQWCVLCL
jgi:predicted secreted protein